MAFSIRDFVKDANALNRLILVNVAVFVLLKSFYTIIYLFNLDSSIYRQLILNITVPAAIGKLIAKPWTLITYMFVHEGFLHILFNMLWLFWLGQIFVEYLGDKKLVSVYILGGISGALLFILAFNVLPAFRESSAGSYALGASAGILAIVVAAATLLPDYKIHLMFIGPVALKWIAAFSIVLDFLSIGEGNAGGHIAHLGGALFGFIYIRRLKQGNDLGAWLVKFFDMISGYFSGRKKMKVVFKKSRTDEEYHELKKNRQEIIDAILDKIAKSGYDSLSKAEKDILFKASKED